MVLRQIALIRLEVGPRSKSQVERSAVEQQSRVAGLVLRDKLDQVALATEHRRADPRSQNFLAVAYIERYQPKSGVPSGIVEVIDAATVANVATVQTRSIVFVLCLEQH